MKEFFFAEDQERVMEKFFPSVLAKGGGQIEVRARARQPFLDRSAGPEPLTAIIARRRGNNSFVAWWFFGASSSGACQSWRKDVI